MVTRRVVSTNYVGIGLAIATGLAANLASSLQAYAQVDPNIQTRIDAVTPPITAQITNASGASPTSPNSPALLSATRLTGNGCLLSEPEKQAIADRKGKKNLNELTAEEVDSALQQDQRLREKVAARPPNPECGKRQPVTLNINLPFNPTYETNILKSGNNSSPGESAGFGGNFLITTGIDGRPWDLVALSGAEASARYTPTFSPSFDSLTSQAAYQIFLHAYGYDPDHKTFVDDLVPGSPKLAMTPASMITFDTLTLGLQNQTAFTPTFKTEKADLLTPQVTLSRQNIGLGEPDAAPCLGPKDSKYFCYSANVSLTAGQTYSDVKTLQNFNVAASAAVSWNIIPTTLTLSLPATATAKDFEDVVGGRRDLLLQIGSVLTYSSKKFPVVCSTDALKYSPYCKDEGTAFTFSLPVSYYKNYSTLSTAAWSGWVIMPTLTIAFSYAKS
jgi:hypothetical protein